MFEEPVRPERALKIKCQCGECLGWVIDCQSDKLYEEIESNNEKLRQVEHKYSEVLKEEGIHLPYIDIKKPSRKTVKYEIVCPSCGEVGGPFEYGYDANYDPPDDKCVVDADYNQETKVNKIWIQ